MRKTFCLPVVELFAFQSEDIICTSADPFMGREADIDILPAGDDNIEI